MAAAQIYNMMMEYPGNVTVKIDGIAASAASVIAMAGTKVLVSPVSMLMIHNPMTAAMGDTSEMQKAIAMLDEVKESIINAYEIKTGMSRAKLSHALLLQAETYRSDIEAITICMTGDSAKVTETNLLLHFVSHADMLTTYSEEFFESYADHIEITGRNEIKFVMKCGLTFTERIGD